MKTITIKIPETSQGKIVTGEELILEKIEMILSKLQEIEKHLKEDEIK